MELLTGWVGLILGFSGLIFIHELGHFLLAKWNGVRVHVFSIGMGPYLVSYTHKGTIYVLSLVPLGGYVKMLGQDDLNADLAENKNPQDFRNKRPGQKAAILAAGAIFNILLTLFIYFAVYFSGYYVTSPCIGNIPPDKALAKAVMYDPDPANPPKPADLKKGDRIVYVNDIPVKSYFDVMLQITACPTGSPIVLAIQRKDNARGLDHVQVNIEEDKKQGIPNVGLDHGTVYEEEEALPLGFTTEFYDVVAEDPAAAKETKDGAAARTGKFKKGDRIVALIDNTDPAHPVTFKMDSKFALTNAAAASQGKPRIFVLERPGVKEQIKAEVKPEYNPDEGSVKFGLMQNFLKRVLPGIDVNSEVYKAGLREGDLVLGFQPDAPHVFPWHSGKLAWIKTFGDETTQKAALTVPDLGANAPKGIFKQDYVAEEFYKAGGPTGGVIDALAQSWDDTRRYTGCMFATLRNLFTGNVKASNLSGPVGIGRSIFTVASKQSLPEYFWWLAFISLNLGVMQMLPIPLLDGFHLVLVAIEKIKGSAVSAKVQEKFFYAGLAMIGSLLVFVMWHDIYRFIFKQ